MAALIPASLGQAQRERLAYIDFHLYFLGEVSRADISSRFGVAPAGATRDLAVYREAAPKNIVFDGTPSGPVAKRARALLDAMLVGMVESGSK